jgi:hypothetical protein
MMRLLLVTAFLTLSGSVRTLSALQAPCALWKADGSTAAGDRFFGNSVARAGDVNGDGYDDVIVGAHRSNGDLFAEGRAYVFHGSVTGLGATPAWVVEGDQEGAWFGHSAAGAGDVNGDGFDDVIVGARNYGNGQAAEGRAFVFLGSAAGLSTTAAWWAESDQPDAHFGSAVSSAGDVNGDGYDDVVVGAPDHDNVWQGDGRAYVYLGSATGLGLTSTWSVTSGRANALYGHSVACAGDVNGDGYDDVAVGAPDLTNDQTREGRVYVYPGSASGLSTTPISGSEGNQGSARFGVSVASAGDVDGDGFADLVVGAESWGFANEGRAFLFRGTPAGLTGQAWSVSPGDGSGHSVAGAGDVNGDGFDEVIVGATRHIGGDPDEGAAFLYHGSPAGPGTTVRWAVEGDWHDVELGESVACAGDVNGDGFQDVVLGVPRFDAVSGLDGRVYVYLGSAAGLSALHVGDGVDRDTIAYVDVEPGSPWSAPLRLGHYHDSGPLSLAVRTTTVTGPVFASPVGGRPTQFLIAGPLLGTIAGSHGFTSGDIPPQPIPAQPSLLGAHWAAQYTVIGGGFADLSRAVFGVIADCP